jgi:hypothetical protein
VSQEVEWSRLTDHTVDPRGWQHPEFVNGRSGPQRQVVWLAWRLLLRKAGCSGKVSEGVLLPELPASFVSGVLLTLAKFGQLSARRVARVLHTEASRRSGILRLLLQEPRRKSHTVWLRCG